MGCKFYKLSMLGLFPTDPVDGSEIAKLPPGMYNGIDYLSLNWLASHPISACHQKVQKPLTI